ncbi:WhiB family transcriptional regulator [Nocardia otitidiscaviarum]|uniref:WhiB family transcriptional regulator n=1 Tax=Nocardia otitidiscaviarum TaxID=1823 RepID=UPI001892F589|nr:WhiB family transcriptional regulator [Nocardia otitidiscaviarum]MBF6138282.1 WhiB family transcriptional regulator [Nocardia otitidiscaviarum]
MKFVAPQLDSEPNWLDMACADLDPDLFFPDDTHDVDAVRAVQRVCRSCPMLRQCAEQARRTRLTDCVVAGVLMPPLNSSAKERAAAMFKLGHVARGGRPTLMRRASTARWSDPELQRQVHELRTSGMKWAPLAAKLNITKGTARKAFDACNPASADGTEAVA